MQVKLSVVVIALNEERRIGEVIDAVSKISDDILVIDSGSKDRTEEIVCARQNTRFIYHKWQGFAAQKNYGNQAAKHDWILSLDADEVPDQKLINEIQNRLSEEPTCAYLINRKSVYLGKEMNYVWQPDYRLRLFHKSQNPVWKGDFVHEKLQLESEVKKLKEPLYHYSYDGLRDHFQKLVKYAELASQEMKQKGKQPSVTKLVVNPLSKFVSHYLVKRGFLDGYRGLIASFSSLVYTFLKYAFLFEKPSKKE